MTTAITVPFHGNTLFVVEHDGQPYTPMKPIVDGMGLAWQPQHAKLKDRFETSITEIVMQMPGDDQKRSVTCLAMRKLAGWLMTIYPNKVKPEIRESIIRYQNECDDALWDYWTKGQATKPQDALKDLRSKKALPGGLTLEQQDCVKDLVKARVEALPAEKRGGAAVTLWSALKSHFGCTYKAISPDHLTDALSLVARVDLEGETPPALAAPVVSPIAHHPGSAARGRERIDTLRLWANRALPDHVRDPFLTALADIERSLTMGWTEVDEATMHIWTGLALLKRWKSHP